jgi:uncharacterized protein (UPF0305 family)
MSKLTKSNKWSVSDNDKLLEALSRGIVNFSMAGKELMMALVQHKEYQFFHEKYSAKQVKNALQRIKNKVSTKENKVDELNEKLSIQNELQDYHGELLFIFFLYYHFLTLCLWLIVVFIQAIRMLMV